MSEEGLEIGSSEEDSSALSKQDESLSLSIPKTLSVAMRNAWQPVPVKKPEVDPDLPELPAIQRSSEVLRYTALQLEYSISPEGGLRGWLKLNVLLSLLIGIPALFLVPILTFLFSSFASWTGFLFQAALNLLYTLLTLVAIGAVLMLIGFIITQMRLRKLHNAQQGSAHQSTTRREPKFKDNFNE